MTTLAEPEWDESTRALVLALDTVPRCPACGGDPALCQDPARQFDWTVPDPVRCHRTTTLREAQQRFSQGVDAEHPDALMWGVHLLNTTGPAGEKS